jgi:two-component system chemotaxis response regulator CheY
MSKKILIVDDSRTIRQQVGFTLTKEGFEVIEAEDGNDGLSKLQGNPDTSMVVSDVNMPNMGGLEMVEAIRQIEQFKFLPIIMLTTESSGDKVERAKKAGASGWLVKPFNPEQLVGAVKKLAR